MDMENENGNGGREMNVTMENENGNWGTRKMNITMDIRNWNYVIGVVTDAAAGMWIERGLDTACRCRDRHPTMGLTQSQWDGVLNDITAVLDGVTEFDTGACRLADARDVIEITSRQWVG